MMQPQTMMKNGSITTASVLALPRVQRSRSRRPRRCRGFWGGIIETRVLRSISRTTPVLQRPDQSSTHGFAGFSGEDWGSTTHPDGARWRNPRARCPVAGRSANGVEVAREAASGERTLPGPGPERARAGDRRVALERHQVQRQARLAERAEDAAREVADVAVAGVV